MGEMQTYETTVLEFSSVFGREIDLAVTIFCDV